MNGSHVMTLSKTVIWFNHEPPSLRTLGLITGWVDPPLNATITQEAKPMSHQSVLPQLAVDHFRQLGFSSVGTDSGGPLFITSVSSTNKRWKSTLVKSIRFSDAELRRLRTEGATHATLSYSGRRVEFPIDDLLADTKVGQPA